MIYVLDTNVVSELRKSTKGTANPVVIAWTTTAPVTSQFVSAITLMELELGDLLKEASLPQPARGISFSTRFGDKAKKFADSLQTYKTPAYPVLVTSPITGN